jgi:polyhydroxyalkanoate synthesis regulator phasin
VNEISESVIYKAMALNETGKPEEAKALVNDLLRKITKKEDSTAEMDYIKSRAYDFLGEHDKAMQFMESSVNKDYNGYMKVRFNDSYIN